jgi:CRP-like cAMP-binding protein
VIATLGQGQVYGDIDYVFNRNYAYSLKVTSNESELYLVRVRDFEKIVRAHRDTWVLVQKNCKERNKSFLDQLINAFKTRWEHKESQRILAIRESTESPKASTTNIGT